MSELNNDNCNFDILGSLITNLVVHAFVLKIW